MLLCTNALLSSLGEVGGTSDDVVDEATESVVDSTAVVFSPGILLSAEGRSPMKSMSACVIGAEGVLVLVLGIVSDSTGGKGVEGRAESSFGFLEPFFIKVG
jgi:hypothetical protein